MIGSLLLGLIVILSVAGWGFMFIPDQDGIWPRTWVVAIGLASVATVGLAVDDRLDTVLGPVSAVEVGLGLAVGVGWLIATHIGHSVLCRMFPTFLDKVNELYSLRDRTNIVPVVGPLVAMGVTEELVFRGFVQSRLGLVMAVVVYAAVQLVVRNWVLFLAGVLCGAIWGTLAWWTGGLVAPIIAHVIWTGALAFFWPLRGCSGEMGPAEADAINRAQTAEDHPAEDQVGDRTPGR